MNKQPIGPHNSPTTTMPWMNHAPLARTQKDTNEGVNEVEIMRKKGVKDVGTEVSEITS